jgi:DNA-binding GntR family transcriptional regulator
MIGTLDTSNLNERAYELLRGAILRAELAPGTRLNVDEIAERLGVSHTPVKDAINRLAAEGLVSILPRKGTFVSTFDVRDLEELLDIRRVLEVRAAELAVGRITQDDICKMSDLLKEMRGLMAEGCDEATVRRERIAKDIAFHRVLVEASGSRRLLEMWETVHAHVLVARATYPLDRFKTTDDEHSAIVTALEAQSLVGLREVVNNHLQHVIDRVREAVRSQS